MFINITFFSYIFLCLGVQKVIISTNKIYFGSRTRFFSNIASVPSLDGVKWQKSLDGVTFYCIDITEPQYYGSSIDPKSPSLLIQKTTFKDAFYYRLLVWNKIGEHVSNTLRLNVTGSMYLCTSKWITKRQTKFFSHFHIFIFVFKYIF